MTALDQPTSCARKRVLIVDDHVLFREGLAGLLRSTPDFDVVGGAGSVREAVEQAYHLKPDIILMDFSLPDGTGLEATQAILAELPACMIVFLTVYEADANLFAAIRKGARGFMLKNIPTANLLASLRSLERGEMAISRGMVNRVMGEFSRSVQPETDATDLLGKLSPREQEVLRELQTGATNQEIARHLYLSENTVKHHIRSILEKLGAENRRQAADLARRAGIGA